MIVAECLNINRRVSQGTVIGQILFSIMVNDVKPIDRLNELVKLADDMSLAVPVFDDSDSSRTEVDSIIEW